MKITNAKLANEIVRNLEVSAAEHDDEIVDAPFSETETTRDIVSLDAVFAREKVVFVEPKTSADKDTAIKYCEVIDPREFDEAEKERKQDFVSSGEHISYEGWCMLHPLREYMSEIPKRKRYKYAPYSDKPIEQFLYEYAFKWSAFALRKLVEWSNTDSRIVKVYCELLRSDRFENHTETARDIVQEALATTLSSMKKKALPLAEHELAKSIGFDYALQYVVRSCDIVDIAKTKDLSKSVEVGKPKAEKFNTAIVRVIFNHFADEDDKEEILLQFNLDNNFAIYKEVCRAVDYWVDHNRSDMGGYDKHGKKQLAISDYVENTLGDWKQERELIRVEGSVEWLKRREEILACIARVKPAGEMRAYKAVLDLLHDGIIDFDNEEPLTKWQVEMILASLSEERSTKTKLTKKMETKTENTLGFKVTKFVSYVNAGHGKFRSVNNARIEYKDGNRDKIVLELATIKNTIFAYCRTLAE